MDNCMITLIDSLIKPKQPAIYASFFMSRTAFLKEKYYPQNAYPLFGHLTSTFLVLGWVNSFEALIPVAGEKRK